MNLDNLIKYLIWIVVFGICAAGIYFLMRNLGVS